MTLLQKGNSFQSLPFGSSAMQEELLGIITLTGGAVDIALVFDLG